jgi:hypothetical protein
MSGSWSVVGGEVRRLVGWDGGSETEVHEPLSEYARAGFSINVHDFASPYPVVACGAFPE